MKELRILGRILLGIPFLLFGITHFLQAGNMAQMVPGFIPGDIIWVYLTGIGFILFAISIIIKKLVGVAGIFLGVTLLIFVFTIHMPGVMSEGIQSQYMTGLLKDLALAGAAFFIAGYYIYKPDIKAI